MLTATGHVKLVDFGLAKFVIGQTYTCCGTPEYMAPEVIANEGHCRAVDWWGLGVLIFELMTGHPPFEDPDPGKIYQKVALGIDSVYIPPKCLGPVSDLCRALLRNVPVERLPMRKAGIGGIKQHPWYTGFSWDSLADGSMQPPYTPIVNGNKDVHHFAHERGRAPNVELEHKDDHPSWIHGFATA